MKSTDLIDGWSEAVRLMNPGDEWLVFVPAAEAFGDQAVGEAIPPNSDLVYRVALEGFLSTQALAVISETTDEAPIEEAAKVAEPEPVKDNTPAPEARPRSRLSSRWGQIWRPGRAYFPWDADKDRVITLPSGLSYVALEGAGQVMLARRCRLTRCYVHYEGRLAETTEFFDSSWSKGEPALFGVGGSDSRHHRSPDPDATMGDRYLVHIPSELAYGEGGDLRGHSAECRSHVPAQSYCRFCRANRRRSLRCRSGRHHHIIHLGVVR